MVGQDGGPAFGLVGPCDAGIRRAGHAANADYGRTHGAAGILMSMWPGLAFIGSAVTALSLVRRSAQREPSAEPVAVDLLTAHTRPPLRLAWPVPAAAPAALPKRAPSACRKRRRSAPVINDDAALRYAPEIESGRIPSMRRVRSEMRVGQAKAQAIVAHLGALAAGVAA